MLSIDDMIELHKMKARAAKNFNARTTVSYTAEEHEQLAEWLEELKAIKEMDLSIPQHFTKEQSDWIKAYCIQRNKEFYNKAIDDFVKKINESNQGHWRPTRYEHGEVVSETMSYDIGTIRLIAEQLKAGDNNGT